MGRTLNEIIAAMPKARQKKIKARAKELIEEYESLRALRKDVRLSQQRIAKKLGISQPAVSKMEHQTDMNLSTIRSYVEALGGELDLVIRLPGRAPVRLQGLEDLHEDEDALA